MDTLRKNEPVLETYRRKHMSVSFFGLPAIKLVSVLFEAEDEAGETSQATASTHETWQPSWVTRLAASTLRRHFTLDRDWHITVSGIRFKSELNGTIIIPARVNKNKEPDGKGELVLFDGASVPMPWLISFLSIGILRPLGVMLTASIVHDFAFKFGHLFVIPEGQDKAIKVPVTREITDRLFREIILSVNKLPVVGWVAWLAVRLGWFGFVPYNGERWGGKIPILELMFTILLCALPLIYIFMPEDGSATDRALSVLASFFGFLLFAYFSTLVHLAIHRKSYRTTSPHTGRPNDQ